MTRCAAWGGRSLRSSRRSSWSVMRRALPVGIIAAVTARALPDAANHSAKVNCYIRRYGDLARKFCRGPGDCDLAGAERHWTAHGWRENRTFGCANATRAREREYASRAARPAWRAGAFVNAYGVDPRVDPSCPVDFDDRYLVLLGVWEQANKGMAVVAEAASLARNLGRTLVEPAYCASRVTPPFDAPSDAGPTFERSFNATMYASNLTRLRAKSWRCSAPKARLADFRNVRDACQRVPMISAAAFRLRYPSLRDSVAFLPHVATEMLTPADQAKARSMSDRAVLYVGPWRRAISVRAVGNGECTSRPCFGVRLGVAPGLVKAARNASKRASPYTCVQWRSEDPHRVHKPLGRCADDLIHITRRAWQNSDMRVPSRRPPSGATVLFVSDLHGESDTYAKTQGQLTARRHLEKYFFGPGRTRRGLAAAGPGAGALAESMVRARGGAARATMEQLLCAAADVVVMCVGRNGCPCGRGLDSGFVSAIYRARREIFSRSTATNQKGGIFDFV